MKERLIIKKKKTFTKGAENGNNEESKETYNPTKEND